MAHGRSSYYHGFQDYQSPEVGKSFWYSSFQLLVTGVILIFYYAGLINMTLLAVFSLFASVIITMCGWLNNYIFIVPGQLIREYSFSDNFQIPLPQFSRNPFQFWGVGTSTFDLWMGQLQQIFSKLRAHKSTIERLVGEASLKLTNDVVQLIKDRCNESHVHFRRCQQYIEAINCLVALMDEKVMENFEQILASMEYYQDDFRFRRALSSDITKVFEPLINEYIASLPSYFVDRQDINKQYDVINGIYANLNYYDNFNLEHVCSVCLDGLSNKEVVQLNCGHEFHRVCVTKWIKLKGIRSSCPVCKRKLFIDKKSNQK